jgi:hypothetical protein
MRRKLDAPRADWLYMILQFERQPAGKYLPKSKRHHLHCLGTVGLSFIQKLNRLPRHGHLAVHREQQQELCVLQ